MRRTVLLISVLLLATLFPGAGSASATRKIFIRDIVLSGTCAKDVSVDALRALLAQEMPRDILAHRGLAYEDLSPYLDAGKWNAESFTVRDARNIMNRVRQFDMKMMLWLEVSCLPVAAGRPSYVLTGRLMDLDRMDSILTCQDAEARDARRVCHSSGDVYDAVTFAHAEMDNFTGFVPAVRHLLARLLRIPEIEIRLDTQAEVFDPGQLISLHFSVRRNDAGHPVPIKYVQQIARLPTDQQADICRDPAQYWEQHTCDNDNSLNECLVLVPFEVAAVRGKKLSTTGGPVIQLRTPSSTADYLVRAEAIAVEDGSEIHSTPTYRCIHVRERAFQVGLNFRMGTPLPNSFNDGITIGPLIFGMDLHLTYAAIRSQNKRPGIALAAVLGATYAGGGVCLDNPDPGGTCFQRYSRSWTGELRGQVLTDVLRVRRMTFRLFADIGVGLESVSTIGNYDDDGLHAVLLGGLGMMVSGHFGLSPKWDLGATFGVMYQARYRVTQENDVMETIQFQPKSSDTGTQGSTQTMFIGQGVPTTWLPLWFTLGLTLASPLPAR